MSVEVEVAAEGDQPDGNDEGDNNQVVDAQGQVVANAIPMIRHTVFSIFGQHPDIQPPMDAASVVAGVDSMQRARSEYLQRLASAALQLRRDEAFGRRRHFLVAVEGSGLLRRFRLPDDHDHAAAIPPIIIATEEERRSYRRDLVMSNLGLLQRIAEYL